MITQPEPPTLGSYANAAASIGQVTTKIFDGLLEFDWEWKPQPSLAESWTVAPDGKSVTFKLRPNVKFHDGKPFTSADVQFTIMDVLRKAHPAGGNVFKDVTAVDTPDAHTAIVRLANPAPYLLPHLSAFVSPMIPKHIYGNGDIRNHAYANKPIGTGPFKFTEWKRGEYVRLDRNPTYWRKGQPYLDRIVVRFIPDASTRSALIEKGEAHVAGLGAVPYQDVKRLVALDTVEVTTKGTELIGLTAELIMNTKRPPFDNVKVRQAVAYAVDRQFIVDKIWFGYARPATGPISSSNRVGLYNSNVRNYNVADRLDRANKLMDEAGFPRKSDGTRIEITHDIIPYGEEWRRYGEAVKQQLASVGIKVNLRYEDVPTWLKRIFTDYDFDLTTNFQGNQADPVIGVMHRAFHTANIKKGTPFMNAARWGNAETDDFLDQAARENDREKRRAMYHRMQEIAAEQVPVIYTHELLFPTLINRRFKGVITSPLGLYTGFNQVWMDR